jgi:hypothetical protein
MAGLLRSKNLWGYANGTKVRPASTTDGDGNSVHSAAQETWDNQAEQAAGLLAMHASSAALSLLTNSSNPKTIWDDLKCGFNGPCPGRRMLTLHELLNVDQQPGEPLDKLGQHIYQLHCQFTSLEDSSYIIDKLHNELFAISAIVALKDDQQAILQENITISEVLLLFQGTASVSLAHTSATTQNSVLLASCAPPSLSMPSKGCDHHKVKTHNTDKCRKLKEMATQQTAAVVMGHMEFAGTASCSRSTFTLSDTHWNPDTGATSTMTPCQEWVHDLNPGVCPFILVITQLCFLKVLVVFGLSLC